MRRIVARGSLSRAVRLIGWAALLAPLGVVLHEAGHWVVGKLLGYPVRLRVASVDGGPALGVAPDWAVAAQASAGPLVTIALMVLAARALRRQPRSAWALALALTAPVRFLVGASFLFFVARAWSRGEAFAGSPNFDEYKVASALDWPPIWLVGAQTALLFGYWIWSVRVTPRGLRIGGVVAVAVGAIIGMTAWMRWAGPWIVRLL